MLSVTLVLQIVMGTSLYVFMQGAEQWVAALMLLVALTLAAMPLFWWARARYRQRVSYPLASQHMQNAHSQLRVGYSVVFICIAVIIVCGTWLVQQEIAHSKGRGALIKNANRQKALYAEIEALAGSVVTNSGFTAEAREKLMQMPFGLRAALDAMRQDIERTREEHGAIMPLITQARVDVDQLTTAAEQLVALASQRGTSGVDIALVASDAMPLIEMHRRSHASTMDRTINALALTADARIHDITRVSMVVSGLLLCSLLLAVFLVLEPAAHALHAQTHLLNDANDAANRLVEERTTDLTLAMRDAHAARVEAERANRMKSMFLANMSHELRTPMHAILDFALLGLERATNDANGRTPEYFKRIESSGERLLKLLNNLLDLSKLEAGQLHIQTQWMGVTELIRPIVDDLAPLAARKDLLIDSRGIDDASDAWIDAERMGQVLRNLLASAIQFTPNGKRIHVSAAINPCHSGASFELAVTDEGIGIPPQELESIFDEFVQSSKTITGAGGTGLGLAICKRIVVAHGAALKPAITLREAHASRYESHSPHGRDTRDMRWRPSARQA